MVAHCYTPTSKVEVLQSLIRHDTQLTAQVHTLLKGLKPLAVLVLGVQPDTGKSHYADGCSNPNENSGGLKPHTTESLYPGHQRR